MARAPLLPLFLLLFLRGLLCDDADEERCGEWARAGFCEQESYQAYMEANCAKACAEVNGAAAEPAQAEVDEDVGATCEQWAAAGYCTQQRYEPYMKQNCARECAEMGEGEGDMEIEEEEEEVAEVETKEEEETGEEPATCEQWAAQGYCDEGSYVEYMKQNCKKTCANVAAGGGSSGAAASGGAGKYSEEECMGWAARGMCHNAQYSGFMAQACGQICANMPEVTFTEELPPPVDPWLVLLIIGFVAAVSHVIKIAYDRDVNSSASMRGKDEVGTRIGNTGSSKRNKAKRG